MPSRVQVAEGQAKLTCMLASIMPIFATAGAGRYNLRCRERGAGLVGGGGGVGGGAGQNNTQVERKCSFCMPCRHSTELASCQLPEH